MKGTLIGVRGSDFTFTGAEPDGRGLSEQQEHWS